MDDALSRLAEFMRVRPSLDLLCLFAEDWAVPHEAEPDGEAPFHIVARGGCRLELPGLARSVPLIAGDVVVLPHGAAHVLRRDGPAVPQPGPSALRSTFNGVVGIRTNTAGPASCELVCGHFRFEQRERNPLLNALPEVIHVVAGAEPSAARLGTLMAVMREEIEEARFGAAAIGRELATGLFTMILRAFVEQGQEMRGVLALLGQAATSRAVAAMLEDFSRDWSLDELARASNASRAALVRAFGKRAGMGPLTLLGQLRMQKAAALLKDTELNVGEVGRRIGYQADEAFSRAFKRHFGVIPSTFRTELMPPVLRQPRV